jgi:threonine/homoserine/homoserine lactone efflux protein
MAFAGFMLETVTISLSGVMAPGPITAVTVGKGSKSPHAGAWVAIGHGIVEFPLVLLIYYGFGRWFGLPAVQTGIALAGGLFLLYMGIGMLRSARRAQVGAAGEAVPVEPRAIGVLAQEGRRPVAAGALLSLGNPYFLIWWATIGAALTMRSAQYGVGGLLAFCSVHWSCDLAWLYLLSVLSFRGGRVFGQRFQQAVGLVCGAFLVLMAGKYLYQAGLVLFA